MFKERLKNTEQFFRLNPPSTDMDGVLINSRVVVLAEFNRLLGTDYQIEDMYGWHQLTNWAIEQGLERKEAERLDIELWYHRPDLLLQAPPIAGALEFVNWFIRRGISLPAITSRPAHLKDVTYAWFEKHLPDFPKKDIYIRHDDSLAGDIFKVLMIKKLGRKVHFEDSVYHAQAILDYTEAGVVLLSNSGVLDYHFGQAGRRIWRFSGQNDKLPDLQEVVKCLRVA